MDRARKWADPVTLRVILVEPARLVAFIFHSDTGVLMSVLATIATAAEEGHLINELWFPAPLFGAIMLALFAALAAVTFSFRDVANRHAEKAEAYAREHGDAQQH